MYSRPSEQFLYLILWTEYFGALVIPAVYLIVTRVKGRQRRKISLGIGAQLFWSGAVRTFVGYSGRHGYSEYYWGWALPIPVNVISATDYTVVIWPRARSDG